MTVKSVDVARYILESSQGPMTTMKLQKLVFYSHAWHLAWTGNPLLSGEIFQAWKNGPVSYELFNMHRGQFLISKSEFTSGDISVLTPKNIKCIDAVIEAYGDLSGGQLSALTHSEEPWLQVRVGLENGTCSSQEISNESLRDFYSKLNKSGTAISKIDWI